MVQPFGLVLNTLGHFPHLSAFSLPYRKSLFSSTLLRNVGFMATETTLSPNQHSELGTRLFGRRFILARVVWVAAVTLFVVPFLAMLPAYYTLLQTVCTGTTCAIWQPTPG